MNKEKIINSFFISNSLQALIQEVSEALNCSVIITDSAFHIVASYSETKSEAYRKAVMHSELSFRACEEIKSRLRDSEGERISFPGNSQGSYIAAVLRCGGVESGYIIYEFTDDFSPPPEEDFSFAEGLLAKQLYLERHSSGSIVSTAEEILTDLLDGKFQNEEIFNLQASGTYLSQFSPMCFALIKHTRNDSSGDNILQHTLTEYFHASHPFLYGGGIIIFIHRDHDLKNLKILSEKFSLKIAVSSEINRLFQMKAEYPVLEKGINYYSHSENNKPFVVFEENFSLFILLKELSGRFALIDQDIKSLFDYDKENNSQLCLTLYTYLICGHSRKQTGEVLFTHHSTISYRLNKIRDEFGIDASLCQKHFSRIFSLALSLVKLGYEDVFINNIDFIKDK